MIDYDAPNGLTITTDSSNPSVFDAGSVEVLPCDPNTDTGCTGTNDGSGYKVSFTGTALSAGATTITLTVTGNNGGATAYVSFTLRWAMPPDSYPPTIEALPNRALRLNSSVNGTVTYSTMFVIGDVRDDGMVARPKTWAASMRVISLSPPATRRSFQIVPTIFP
jgi:hypothetical protein